MTIPASDIVVVNPGVVGSGGNPLALNGVILSKSASAASSPRSPPPAAARPSVTSA